MDVGLYYNDAKSGLEINWKLETLSDHTLSLGFWGGASFFWNESKWLLFADASLFEAFNF